MNLGGVDVVDAADFNFIFNASYLVNFHLFHFAFLKREIV
jgi:hypothetical protein